jgi:hypothetical protein
LRQRRTRRAPKGSEPSVGESSAVGACAVVVGEEKRPSGVACGVGVSAVVAASSGGLSSAALTV